MSAVAARSSGARPSAMRARSPLLLGLAAAGLVALVALALAGDAGVKRFGAVPDVLRIAGSLLLLFGAAGYPITRLLLPRALRAHFPLFVLPVGAATAAMALTVLGFAHVPLPVSVALLVVTGAAAGALMRVRDGPLRGEAADLQRAGGRLLRLGWPIYLALVVACISLIPTFRANYVTLMGQNGDAILAAGTADFLQNSPPRGEDVSLYVDRMPSNWRSKYPIYYALAGVTELSGMRPEQALPIVTACMLALAGLSFMLLSFYLLGAGAVGALFVLALVPLDRVLLYLGAQPFYNQLWGVFALPLVLLTGFRFLREPSAWSAALFALFGALGAFAYPLMLPFPAVALGLAAILDFRRARAAGRRPPWWPSVRLPRGRRSLLLWIPLGLLAAPVAVVATAGVVEKLTSAAEVILPGSNLLGWNALPFYLPFHKFFGMTDPLGLAWLSVAALIAAAGYALWRLPRHVGIPIAAMCAGALAFAAYFKARQYGVFFYFKILGFLGPIVLALAVVALTGLVREARQRALRIAAVGATGLLCLFAIAGARIEAFDSAPLFGKEELDLREWSQRIPANDSVVFLLPRDGSQLTAGLMLSRHPVSATNPFISTTFPSPPRGFKADWLLAKTKDPPPLRYMLGDRPRFANDRYALWRMRPDVKARDLSSRRSIELFTSVFDR